MAVFGLKKIYLNQVENNYENYDQVTVSSYGYLSGGQGNPGPGNIDYSFIHRVDFDNETLSQIGTNTLQGNTHYQSAVFNSDYAWVAGGLISGPTISCTIDRFDYSNETNQNPGNPLPNFSADCAAVMNSQYGFLMAGAPSQNTVNRIDFSNETTSSPGNNLSLGRNSPGHGYSSLYGYAIQGFSNLPARTCTIERINFSDETIASSTPSIRIRNAAGSTQSTTNIYTAGGAVPSITCVIERFNFSSETTTDTPSQLSQARRYAGGLNDSNYGYFIGGTDPVQSTVIDRLDFYHETTNISSQRLPQVAGKFGCFEGGSKITRGKPQFNSIQREINQESCGYIASGIIQTSPGYISKSNVLKLDFSTDLSTELTARLSIAEPTGTNSVKSRDYGYFGGGYNIPGPFTTYCTIDRFDFTSETMMTPGTGLTQNAGFSATTQTTSFGYFIGGQTSTPTATCLITRLDYSTESTSQQSLYKARKRASAIENQLYAYITGTFTTATSSEISRYDFVNETSAAIPAVTTTFLEQSTATGNNQFGFIHLGYTFPAGDSSTINRIDYSNETINAPGNNLTNQVRNAGSVSSNTSGYFGGGYGSPNTFISTLDKIDFDTETKITTNSLVGYRGRLTKGVEGKSTLTQTTYNTVPESASYGYFGGGYHGGAPGNGTSNIDRVDYETDTTSLPSAKVAFIGAPGGSIRGKFAGIESTQFGYILGGQAPTPTLSTIQKLDFISETLGVSDKNLSQVSRGGSAFKSRNYAYYGGSYINGSYTAPKTLERIDFDTETINVFGNISKGRTFTASTQSRDYGYVTGGNNYPPGLAENNIDKVDLSNENISQPIYQFSTPIVGHKIAQNQSNAYIFGGGSSFAGGTSNIKKLDFSDDTISSIAGKVGRGNVGAGEYTENSNYGYGSLGYSGPSPSTATFYSQVERFDFQTETSSSPGSNLSLSRFLGASFSGGSALRQVGKNNRNDSRAGLDNQGRNVSASYGYFIGGENNASYLTRNDRLDMLNETIIISTPAAAGGKYTCIEADSSTGYSMPGEGPGGNSNLFRFDFTNETFRDTATDFPANPTSNRPAVRSTNYAYFNQGASTVEKLDFTTDTFVDSQSHSLQPRASSFNASATSYGYIAGGNISDIERLDFSSENRTVLNVDLPSGIRYSGTSLNQNSTNNIYFVAGYNGTVRLSSIEKLDITTETSSASANNIGYYTNSIGSSQNENYGYIAGGASSPTGGDFVAGGLSRVCRIELVNETASLPGTNLSQSRYGVDGMSNAQ